MSNSRRHRRSVSSHAEAEAQRILREQAVELGYDPEGSREERQAYVDLLLVMLTNEITEPAIAHEMLVAAGRVAK